MPPRFSAFLASSLFAVTGCGDSAPMDAAMDDTGTSTGAVSTSSGATTELPTDGTSTSAGETGVDTGFDPPDPECGNGFVEPGEQCDDGNDIDDDDCNNECMIPCGMEWEVTELPPTGESTITGLQVARDTEGGFITAGMLREITSDEGGMTTQGPHEVLLIRYDSTGEKQWDTRISLGGAHTRLGALAVDASGGIYVGMTVDASEGSDIVVSKRAGSDGGEIWQHVHDSQVDTSVDSVTGLATTPDGDVIVVGTVRAGPMDNDVFIRRLGAQQGDELWTSIWSGGPSSSDFGGPVTVGPSGATYVLVRELIDFQTAPVVLLRLPPEGPTEPDGEAERLFVPQHAGAVQIFEPVAVQADANENVVLALERTAFTGIEFWVHKIDDTGAEVWQRERDDYVTGGEAWRLVDVTLDDDDGPALVGRFRNVDPQQQLNWTELWLRRLDPSGTLRCALNHRASGDDLIPPSLVPEGATTRSDGGPVVTGMIELGADVALWLATFRPS